MKLATIDEKMPFYSGIRLAQLYEDHVSQLTKIDIAVVSAVKVSTRILSLISASDRYNSQ